MQIQNFTLTNVGTIRTLPGGPRIFRHGTLTNTGTLDIQTNTDALFFNSALTIQNAGTLTIAAGATLHTDNLHNNVGGTITNNGTVSIESDYTQDAGNVTGNPIAFNVAGILHRTGAGTVAIAVTNTDLTLDGNLLSANQTIALHQQPALPHRRHHQPGHDHVGRNRRAGSFLQIQNFTLTNVATTRTLPGGPRIFRHGTLTNTGTLDIQTNTDALFFNSALTIQNAGTLTIAAGATLHTDNFTQTPSGTFHTTIDAAGPFGRLVADAGVLAGTLEVTTIGSPAGPSYDVVTGTISGAFGTLNYGSQQYQTAYSANAVMLSIPGNYRFGSLALSSSLAGATGVTYTLDFEGPALGGGSSTLTLTAPAGTVFPAGCANYLLTDTTSGASQTSASVTGGGTAAVTITVPFGTAVNDHLTLAVTGVTNTSPFGRYSLTLATGANTLPLGFVLGNPSAPSITSADHATFTVGAAGSFTVTGTGSPTLSSPVRCPRA